MSVLPCMMHSYDLYHKHIRQAILSTRFSVVTALCEVYICSTNQFYDAAFLAIYRIPSPLSLHFTKQTHVSE